MIHFCEFLGDQLTSNLPCITDLILDYRTNLALYPKFRAFFGEYQPPTLIVWGKNDFVFPSEGATPYARDLKNIKTPMLDTGLEMHGEEVASHIESFFLKRQSKAA
jgi:pimeloyl-ACP methyl ester carboxylesterase